MLNDTKLKMPADPKPTRKPCIQTKPYQQKPKAAVSKDGVWHRTAVKPIPTKKHETLTLHDWMTLPCFKKPISTVENQDLPTISKARVPPPPSLLMQRKG